MSDALTLARHRAAWQARPELRAVYREWFERLLGAWRARGFALTDVASYAQTLEVSRLPRCEILSGAVAGRSGTLAVQGQEESP